MEIEIKYDGSYPNLCSGNLFVTITGSDIKRANKEWDFGAHNISSGGGVWFDDEWSEHIDDGEWSIDKYPENFPEELKNDVLEAVNSEIEHGCCGGCV